MLVTLLLVVASLTSPPVTRPATQPDDWKQAVMQTAGIDVWPSVTRLQFTFVVEFPDGRAMKRTHDWNLADGTATVDGVTIRPWDFDVVNADDAQKSAYSAWINDGYWLLMPLKLDDPGVNFTPVGASRDMPPSRAMVTMTFDDGTGLTPGDAYDLAIDLRRGVVDAWTYRPDETRAITWTWE
ncbi:MAG: hypothetical protein AAF561_09795, partial [Planctomycetota bacterium]